MKIIKIKALTIIGSDAINTHFQESDKLSTLDKAKFRLLGLTQTIERGPCLTLILSINNPQLEKPRVLDQMKDTISEVMEKNGAHIKVDYIFEDVE